MTDRGAMDVKGGRGGGREREQFIHERTSNTVFLKGIKRAVAMTVTKPRKNLVVYEFAAFHNFCKKITNYLDFR